MTTPLFRCSLLLVSVLALAACSAPKPKPAATFDHVQQELKNDLAKPRTPAPGKDLIGEALLPPVQLDMAALKKEPEPRFNLAVNAAPATHVFMALVADTKYSMLFPQELSGNITLNLKEVTLREALDTIRELYGFEYRVQGNRIFIQANAPQTRVFQVNYLAGKRQGMSELAILASGTVNTGTSTNTAVNTGSMPTVSGTSGSTGSLGGSSGSQMANTSSRVQMSSEVDFWSNLETALNAIVGSTPLSNQPQSASQAATSSNTTQPASPATSSPGVVVNRISGIVVVRAMPRELRLVENYLRSTQAVVERQVMLEAKIVEVKLSEGYQAGVNWSAFSNRAGSAASGGVATGASTSSLSPYTPGTPNGLASNLSGLGLASAVTPGTNLVGGLVGLAFQTANFAALLNFLETQGAVQVLSSPRIATLNNQKAVLKVGYDVVRVTGYGISTTTTNNVQISTPSPIMGTLFSGISLDVLPQIDDDGNIVLHVHPAISEVTNDTVSLSLNSTGTLTNVQVAKREVSETDSIVRVRDGNIVAIGGLMKHRQEGERSGLPGTTQSSYGVMAGQRSSSLEKRELVILIRPTIISTDLNWTRDLEATAERIGEFAPVPKNIKWP